MEPAPLGYCMEAIRNHLFTHFDYLAQLCYCLSLFDYCVTSNLTINHVSPQVYTGATLVGQGCRENSGYDHGFVRAGEDSGISVYFSLSLGRRELL